MRVYLGMLKRAGKITGICGISFRHGASYELGDGLPRLFVSYHPSQQNTFTGKLTEQMMESVLHDIRQFLEQG